MARLNQLRGRIAVITGGGRGIGRCTAKTLLEAGLRVVVADIDEVSAQRTADDLSGIGPKVVARHVDVTDAKGFADLIAGVERDLGPVDVLVNNAGIMPVGSFLQQAESVDRRQFDINVHGVIGGMRAVLPYMLQRNRGHIINIASVAGRVSAPGIANYAGTKHAVIGITEGVRREYRKTRLQFSYVMPTLTNTELASGARPLRFPPNAEPEDVANAVLKAIRTGKVDLYVPRIARIGHSLPAILPRRVYEAIGDLLGAYDMFTSVDDGKRAAYAERIGGEAS